MRRIAFAAATVAFTAGMLVVSPTAASASTHACTYSYPLVGGEMQQSICTTITGTGLTINSVKVGFRYYYGHDAQVCGIFQLDKNDPDNYGDGGGTVIWDSPRTCITRNGGFVYRTYTGPYTYAKNGTLTAYWLPTAQKNNFTDDWWSSPAFGIKS